MKKTVLIIVLLISAFSYSQEEAWVYFKDNNHYFIRDYSTGKPINQADVKIFETKYDYKTSC